MEFAVIKTGGKQYIVKEGDVLNVEKLSSSAKPLTAGDKIVFDEVLLVDDGKDTTLGMPFISGAKVSASVVEEGRDRKIRIMKYKAKVRFRKTQGHRQPFTKVKIDSIKK